jgi:hypothetical protein
LHKVSVRRGLNLKGQRRHCQNRFDLSFFVAKIEARRKFITSKRLLVGRKAFALIKMTRFFYSVRSLQGTEDAENSYQGHKSFSSRLEFCVLCLLCLILAAPRVENASSSLA